MIDVEIRTTEPATIAFKRMHGSFAQIPEAIKDLYVWAGMHFLQPGGGPSAVYYTVPQDGDDSDAEWEIYFPLARDSKPKEPDKKGRGVRHLEGKQVAVAVHKGSYESIADTYNQLGDWVVANGYRMAGPPEESYLSDPKDTAPEDYLTELRFPVEKV